MDVLMEHERKLHTKQCKECDFKFRTNAELEEHEMEVHDPFNENVKTQDITMRLNEEGEFVTTKDLSSRQYFAQNSQYKRRQRMIHQMSQIQHTEVVDESVKKSAGHHRFGTKGITAHSFIKRQFDNTLYRAAWTPAETRRFYATLKYSGSNFVFAEAIYNKLVPVKIKTKKEDTGELYIDSKLIKDEDDKDIKRIRRRTRRRKIKIKEIRKKKRRSKRLKKKKRDKDRDKDNDDDDDSGSESDSHSDSDSDYDTTLNHHRVRVRVRVQFHLRWSRRNGDIVMHKH